ncbi:unnamed protein product [Heligmosomoides polygyrus]|uniref:Guanylate cyclase n=1 Tax=Heligmosomoides polygyrus TaxID=6339 RepID=A0A3P8AFC0_HELPZ|nr:unnamed protein product [Heligmosomoides polygyrus]
MMLQRKKRDDGKRYRESMFITRKECTNICLMNDNDNMTMTYRRQLTNITNSTFKNALRYWFSCVVFTVICLESVEARRNLMISIVEEGMDSNEYMWLMLETRRLGFGKIFCPDIWNNALHRPRRLDCHCEITHKIRAETFLCFQTYSQVGELADAMLLYAITLNRSIAAGLQNPTGRQLVPFSVGYFEGFSGTVLINKNYTRDPVFLVYAVDPSGQQTVVMRVIERLDNDSVDLVDLVAASVIWAGHGGSPPRNRPICDFNGSACPKSFIQQYLAITIAVVVIPIILVVLVVSPQICRFRSRRIEEERLNGLWQLPYVTLLKPNTKNALLSSRSLESTITTSTKLTIESKKDTLRHAFYILDEESVAARKHAGRPPLKKVDCASMRKMRNIDHDNICKFYGLSLDGPQFLSVWKYAPRGSLKDVIAKGSIQMDWFFKYSLIRDICEAVHYIHHSSFSAHGWISSGTCLVDERWQNKLPLFLFRINILDYKKPSSIFSDFLWVAPEHIRNSSLPPTKEGDIYSFAIVCSEIITKKSAWDMENQDYDVDELIYKIKRGGRSPVRPLLESDEENNASLMLLVKDCWSEEIDQRPSSDQVKSLIKSLNHNKTANLMDHVFNVLEQYASNLEDEVQSRMKELTEEKKKSDILLYRMLPKQVAEKLKLGLSVEPETFDCVTLFFSDVVSFTTLASRCTPLQVVNLLNDLYTLFDAIIDEHDVYKVETIGDGYLCVSGLPHRNGNEHAKEVAEMSFELLKAIRGFRVPHLPTEKINIRVGLHTGSVVTGVVGMTMPRYCLFGDAVNTASRMESNGKPGRVHISTDTKKFLTEVIGGYKTEPRGEVLVKGKGALETHWLLTPEEQQQNLLL